MKISFWAGMMILTFLCFASDLEAQYQIISKVVSENGEAVAFATISDPVNQQAVIADESGRFVFQTEKVDFTLRVSSIGFETTDFEVSGGNIPPSLILKTSKLALQEVVVTALGIGREKQTLSASVSKLVSKEIASLPTSNLVNALSGKVAGIQITNGSSGVGSSSRIVIRGENSLTGSNQALFVIDGMPISNELVGSDLINNGALQEVDFGNGVAELSPEDIEAVTILKGAGAAALYGSRAANGVVLISTKKGRAKKGLGISFNTSATMDKLLTLPQYQNEYGGGNNGTYAFQNGRGGGINDGGLSSYGPRLDQGNLIAQFDSPSVDVNGQAVRAGDVAARLKSDGSYTAITPTPWISRPDNVKNFFETGLSLQNNLSISSSSDQGSLRLSYTNFRNKGILPNTNLKRDGISLGLRQDITPRLHLQAYGNYIYSRSDNRPNLGYGYENVMYGFGWTGRQTDIASMRNYWQAGREGLERFDINYLWLTNPYLTLYENTNAFDKNRVIGNAVVSYDLSDHFQIFLKAGADNYDELRKFKRAVGTNANPYGSYREDKVGFTEMNYNAHLEYKNRWMPGWDYELAAGANRFNQDIGYSYAEASQLALPSIYTLANSRTPLKGNSEIFRKQINSLYGSAHILHKEMLFLDLTMRNDWSSTLPSENNSFAYYSAGLSYILSRHFSLPEQISYLKLRFNSASVGNDTNPYQNAQSFLFNQNYGSDFKVTNEKVLKNAALKPERLNALEGGLEIWMFKDRLQADFSVYQNTSIDQIISRPVSSASGFQNFNVNGGEVRTRGLEVSVSGMLMRRGDFTWNSNLNYTTFRSVVTELPAGVDQFVTGSAKIFSGSGGSNEVFYIARQGGRVGDMYGTGFVEVDGQTLYGSNGLPVQDGKLRLLGNYNPDFIVGWSHLLKYKSFEMSVLADWRQGGTIVSRTKFLGFTAGVLEETLEGRETGIIGEGIVNVGTSENPQYVPNTKVVGASQFYNNYYDRGNEASSLYDASYVKIREISLYYNLPEKWCQKTAFESLRIGLVATNVFLFTENPHFDPELNAMEGRYFTYGVEDISYPSTRNFGFSIKTQF